MKKILYLSVSLCVMCGLFLSICLAQKSTDNPEKKQENQETQDVEIRAIDPVNLLDEIVHEANLYKSEDIQNTALNHTTSKYGCNDSINVSSNFSISKTLCNIKSNVRSYLQYIIWIGLTAATIILIRNGFELVTSTDRGKQIGVFKKNIIYIIIGVALILSFYWILDIFVSLVNLVAE